MEDGSGGGGSALACCTMGPFALGDRLYHGGWGLQGRGLCVTLSFEVKDFWRWDWSLVRFNLFES